MGHEIREIRHPEQYEESIRTNWLTTYFDWHGEKFSTWIENNVDDEELRNTDWHEEGNRLLEGDLEAFFNNKENLIIIGLFDDDEVFGGIYAEPLENEICECKRTCVHPDLRGNGYGRELVETLLSKCYETGFKKAQAAVAPYMETAWSMYQEIGWYLSDNYDNMNIPQIKDDWRTIEIDIEEFVDE